MCMYTCMCVRHIHKTTTLRVCVVCACVYIYIYMYLCIYVCATPPSLPLSLSVSLHLSLSPSLPLSPPLPLFPSPSLPHSPPLSLSLSLSPSLAPQHHRLARERAAMHSAQAHRRLLVCARGVDEARDHEIPFFGMGGRESCAGDGAFKMQVSVDRGVFSEGCWGLDRNLVCIGDLGKFSVIIFGLYWIGAMLNTCVCMHMYTIHLCMHMYTKHLYTCTCRQFELFH
jgi:hypothetical protein